MHRYIDVDGLYERVKDYPYGFRGMILDDIAQVPSADVVEVVRCKDCLFGHRYFKVINGETDSWVECRNPEGLNRDVSDDGYCSASTRRR